MAISSSRVGGVQKGQGLLQQGMQNLNQSFVNLGQRRREDRLHSRDTFNQQLEGFLKETGMEGLVLFNPELAQQYAQNNGIDISGFKQKMAPIREAIKTDDPAQLSAAYEALQDSTTARQHHAIMGHLAEVHPQFKEVAQQAGYTFVNEQKTPEPPAQKSSVEGIDPNTTVSVNPRTQVTDTITEEGSGEDLFSAVDQALGGALSSGQGSISQEDDPTQFPLRVGDAVSQQLRDRGIDPESPKGKDIRDLFAQYVNKPLTGAGSQEQINSAVAELRGQLEDYGAGAITENTKTQEMGRQIQDFSELQGLFAPMNQDGTLNYEAARFKSLRDVSSPEKRNELMEQMGAIMGMDTINAFQYEALRQGAIGAYDRETNSGIPEEPDPAAIINWAENSEGVGNQINENLGLRAKESVNVESPEGVPPTDAKNVSNTPAGDLPIVRKAQEMVSGDVTPMERRQMASEMEEEFRVTYDSAIDSNEKKVQTLQQEQGMSRQQALETVGTQYVQSSTNAAQAAENYLWAAENDPTVQRTISAIDPQFSSELSTALEKNVRARSLQQQYREMVELAPERMNADKEMLRLETMQAEVGVKKAIMELWYLGEQIKQMQSGEVIDAESQYEDLMGSTMFAVEMARALKGTELEGGEITDQLGAIIEGFLSGMAQPGAKGIGGFFQGMFTPNQAGGKLNSPDILDYYTSTPSRSLRVGEWGSLTGGPQNDQETAQSIIRRESGQ